MSLQSAHSGLQILDGFFSQCFSSQVECSDFVFESLMFLNGVQDMRDMIEGDVRFTLPFGMEI